MGACGSPGDPELLELAERLSASARREVVALAAAEAGSVARAAAELCASRAWIYRVLAGSTPAPPLAARAIGFILREGGPRSRGRLLSILRSEAETYTSALARAVADAAGGLAWGGYAASLASRIRSLLEAGLLLSELAGAAGEGGPRRLRSIDARLRLARGEEAGQRRP